MRNDFLRPLEYCFLLFTLTERTHCIGADNLFEVCVFALLGSLRLIRVNSAANVPSLLGLVFDALALPLDRMTNVEDMFGYL